MKNETFWQFITRPTGFGKTGWGAFALIMTAVVMLTGIGIGTRDDGGIWAISFAVAIVAVLMWGTWRNWRGKQG